LAVKCGTDYIFKGKQFIAIEGTMARFCIKKFYKLCDERGSELGIQTAGGGLTVEVADPVVSDNFVNIRRGPGRNGDCVQQTESDGTNRETHKKVSIRRSGTAQHYGLLIFCILCIK
jgi:hypothetical protein